MRRSGNIERYLTYGKLHRTGRLLRGLKTKVMRGETSSVIQLYNNTPYASDHEQGGNSGTYKTIKKPYVHNGANAAVLGGNVEKRPSMQPSAQVLSTPQRLLENKMKEYGWLNT